VEGDGAANIISSGKAVRPAVEIRRMGGALIAGASVQFTLPKTGARAVFLNESTSATAISGQDGRALAPEMRPVGEGSFHITVTVKYSGETALAAITQTNFQNETEAAAAGTPRSALSDEYRIEILEGDDGVNIISKKTAVRTLVRVVDKNNLPVAAVPVVLAIVFTRGAGESKFPDGNTSITVLTDAQGKAEAPPIRPQKGGKFEIRVQAKVNGAIVNRVIAQNNFPTPLAAAKVGKVPGSSAPAEGASGEISSGTTGSGNGSASTTANAASTPAPSAAPSAAAGAGGAAGAGMSSLQILGLVGGGLLAAGGIATAAGVGSRNDTRAQTQAQSQRDCTGTFGSFLTSAQAVVTCAQSARDPNTQCRTFLQQMTTALGPLCTCVGGIANAPAEIRNLYTQLQSLTQQAGLSFPSSCRP